MKRISVNSIVKALTILAVSILLSGCKAKHKVVERHKVEEATQLDKNWKNAFDWLKVDTTETVDRDFIFARNDDVSLTVEPKDSSKEVSFKRTQNGFLGKNVKINVHRSQSQKVQKKENKKAKGETERINKAGSGSSKELTHKKESVKHEDKKVVKPSFWFVLSGVGLLLLLLYVLYRKMVKKYRL